MNTSTIILGTALVVLIIYMIFKSYFDGKNKMTDQVVLQSQVSINNEDITKPNAGDFTYGIWIYVNKWIEPTPGGTEDIIFKRADEMTLKFSSGGGMKIFPRTGDNPNMSSTGPIKVTDNFPIQKWVYVTIVSQQNNMDVYLDGKMVKSIQMKGKIAPGIDTNGLAANGIDFGRGTLPMNTTISKFTRFTYSMNPQDVWTEYMKGNGSNGLTKAAGDMNVNLSVMKDGIVSSSYKLL
jgi:hypothetical protein